jgi:uncharacterized repeat protein (TIGR01451 family)
MRYLKFSMASSIATIVLPLMAGAAYAQNALTLSTEAFQEVEVAGKDGKMEKKTVPVAKVTPGTEVTYVITYKNVGDKPADKVVVNNPVPKELAYRSGSADGKGARSEVSVDGGRHYGALPGLKVEGADGKPRPAEAADVTHLRWLLAQPVAPGAQGVVSYRATLK